MYTIQMSRFGGPEVLEWRRASTPEPGDGDLLVQMAASGVNFIDTYYRSGIYKPQLPFVPGSEGAGIVVAVGGGVTGIKIGDLVASSSFRGSYAEQSIVAFQSAVHVPTDISPELAAATLLQGLTAHYLVHDSYPLRSGELCLIHAGAGGVGRLLVQLAKRAGATVFTTVSTADKAELARSAGANHVINYVEEDFAKAVSAIAGPRPLATIYDGVGAATFDKGLTLLKPQGTMVLFGQSSGVVPPFDLGRLAPEGSLFVTRPTLNTFVATRDELVRRAGELFSWMDDGTLEVRIGHRYPLSDAQQAHIDLQARRTTGKILLIP
jgi:NADPH2:quinone reductase